MTKIALACALMLSIMLPMSAFADDAGHSGPGGAGTSGAYGNDGSGASGTPTAGSPYNAPYGNDMWGGADARDSAACGGGCNGDNAPGQGDGQ